MTSVHARGLEALSEQRRYGARAGQFVVTPGQMEAKIAEVKAGVEALDHAIASYQPPTGYAEKWAIWVHGWNFWRDAWRLFASSPPSTWWGHTYEQILAYEQKLGGWQRDFARQWQGQVPGPMAPAPPAPETFWSKVGSGIAIAVATGAVLWVLRELVTTQQRAVVVQT